MQRLQLSTVLALTLVSTFAGAEVYKWVDTDGNVHYGGRPPATALDSRSVPLPPAPVKDADHEQRSLKRRRLLEAFEAERAERELEEVEAAAAKRELAKACEKVRRDLARIERAQSVYTTHESGARIYMSDEERREATDGARAWIGKHCD